MDVQIFGVKKSAATRAALRFFAERRIRTHFVDLNERAAAPRELERFARKFGVRSLVDRTSRRFADLGLGTAQLTDTRWLEKLAAEPLLLVMPLARCGNELALGDAPETWARWVAAGRPSTP